MLSGRAVARHGARLPLLTGMAGGAVAALLLAQAGAGTPPWLVVTGGTLMFLAIGYAIPAMTATVMGAGGKDNASAAGAALNASRQIGALLGVAVAGTLLHAVPAWRARLAIVYGAIAAAYALACVGIYRHVQPAATGALAAAAE
jgi:DHA2 family methylenomycin A resistance protein-like MFS transporter